MTDDPQYFHVSESDAWPPRVSVSGFSFDPAAGTIDFSEVPDFNLGRLQSLWHSKSKTWLFVRPTASPYDLAAIDGEPVPSHPTSGHVLKVRPDTRGMRANDEIVALYDHAFTGLYDGLNPFKTRPVHPFDEPGRYDV